MNLFRKNKNFTNIVLIDIAAYLLCAIFVIAGILVSLNRFWQYEVFFYDFGIFDQAIWKVSQFRPPVIDHYVIFGKWIFADHFNPSIFLFSPIYWVTHRSEILLVAQAVVVGVSGIVLYAIGKNLTKHALFSFAILSAYFFFVGLQNAVISDFHEVTASVLPLTLTFWAVVKKKPWFYFLFLFITLGFKESTFGLGIGIAIAILFLQKAWGKIALATVLISLAWGILSINVVIPYFSGGFYSYTPQMPPGFTDKVTAFFDEPIKRKTLFYSFYSFGFLPLFSPPFWALILQDFAARFLPQYTNTRWDLGLHYSAQLSVILGLSSLYAFRFVKRIINSQKFISLICILIILNALFLYRFVLRGPFGLSYNIAFYKHTNDFKFLDEVIKKVPKNKSIMTQNNLAVRFTHQDIFLLRQNYEVYKPDYILVDDRAGQNPNDFFGIGEASGIIKALQHDSRYSLVYNSNEQFLFKRK